MAFYKVLYVVQVEKQSPETPEYVLVTLRLAEVFAAKGERRMAESGFKHALQIQRTVRAIACT